MTVKQCEAFETLVGRFAGWLDLDFEKQDELKSDLLGVALRYGAPQSFVDEYQEWSAR